MALSTQERTAKHRALKAAKAFRLAYLDDKEIVSPDEFVAAKIDEAQQKIIGVVTEFDCSLTNPFYTGLVDLPEQDKGYYLADDLFLLWKSIEDELYA